MFSLIPFSGSLRRSDPFFHDSFLNSFMNYRDLCAGFCVDVKEEKDHYELTAEVPGVSKEQLQVSAQEDVLTITVERQEQTREEGKLYAERRYGRASRSFSLEGIDQEGMTASLKDGVLTLMLPKSHQEKKTGRRDIEILSDSPVQG